MKALKNIQPQFQEKINDVIDRLLSDYNKVDSSIDFNGIEGFVADTERGYAHYDGRFTVPLWALIRPKGTGYFVYYVAHELSHQLRYKKYDTEGSHDFKFYEIFTKLCPTEFQHFELNYKKSASKYGVI